ncbi:TPA: hypothetical protein ACKLV4_002200, partial [Neisseria gonorrhoeae]
FVLKVFQILLLLCFILLGCNCVILLLILCYFRKLATLYAVPTGVPLNAASFAVLYAPAPAFAPDTASFADWPPETSLPTKAIAISDNFLKANAEPIIKKQDDNNVKTAFRIAKLFDIEESDEKTPII